MSAENASQHEANKMLRVLSGERLKYTVRVHKADGSVVEWQSNTQPILKYNDEARALWLSGGPYSSDTCIMPWQEGMVILTEENK